MIRDRKFYSQYMGMWLILVLQSVITLVVNLADNVMLGAYSEISLSGVAAVNQVQFVYQQVLMALGEGVVVLGTQYYGRKETEPIRKFSAIGMRAGLLVAAALFAMVSLFPSLVLRFFTNDGRIVEEGVGYLSVVRFTYPFFAVTQLLLATLRSTGTVRIALELSGLALVVNCGINYTLIYGRFGAPELGVVGAAMGTLTARVLEMIVLIFYVKYREGKLDLHVRTYCQTLDKKLSRDYIRIVSPMLVVNGLWGLNNAVQNAILGHMTKGAIAANSAASTLFLLVKSMASGAAATSSYFIGITIGRGETVKEAGSLNQDGKVEAGDVLDSERSDSLEYGRVTESGNGAEKRRSNDLENDPYRRRRTVRENYTLSDLTRTLQVLDVLIGICAGIVLYNLRLPVLSRYSFQPATMAMAKQFLTVLSVVVVFMSYQMPVNNGIIRAGGDVKFVMVMDLISIWGIVIPVSLVAAFALKLPPLVVICCLNGDQVFKCLPAFIKCNYGHWAKKLTR